MEGFLYLLKQLILFGAGAYGLYTCIRLRATYSLFENKFMYPANCKPGQCADEPGFIGYIFPRLLIFSVVFLALGLLSVVAVYGGGIVALPAWLDDYVIPSLGVAMFVIYCVWQGRAAKLFW